MFNELFTTLGCDVVAVSNCTDALTVAPKFQPHIVFSSLIFVDMSGLDLCSQLRRNAELDKTVFVALTGYLDVNIRQKVREAGFHHYLLKPVNFSSLLEPFKGIPSLETSCLQHERSTALQ